MTWINAPENIDEYVGFVYRITELDTQMSYIGIKKYWKINKKKPGKYKKENGKFLKDKYGKRVLETRTLKIHTKVESGWKTYNSSNKELQEKIKNNPNNYEKVIISNCKTVSEMKLKEAYMQLQIYFNGNWNKLYNEMINLRIRIRKDKK